MIDALRVDITAPIASFRNPLFQGLQVGLPCPPPSTIAGLLAAAAGGWQNVDTGFRFAMAFTSAGTGVDLETWHPLDAKGRKLDPQPRDREFLIDPHARVWITQDVDLWERRLRRPVWPLRLGRSQDLATARTTRITLTQGTGRQGHALIPAELSRVGQLLQLSTVVALDRLRTRWDPYRYLAAGIDHDIDDVLVTVEGQAVVMLSHCHPQSLAEVGGGHG